MAIHGLTEILLAICHLAQCSKSKLFLLLSNGVICKMANNKTLRERIQEFEFHPEVYLYPTPRMYDPLTNFTLEDAIFTEDVNVYVHIPFCKQICSFCGYLKIIDSQNLRAEYVDAVVKEIKLYQNILDGRKVRTLYFGGGTPSLLTPKELEKIITSLLEVNPAVLKTSEEISIEATPESVEESKFKQFKDFGINRVSLGVQSFNNSEIVLSKRKNLSEISIKAIESLRKIGIPNVVIDLMIGIEGQTVQSFEESVKEALELRPETVELYALGLMPQTGLGKKVPSTLMADQDIYRCYELGRELFLAAGYVQDCHNRYVIPGKGSFLQEDYVFEGMSLLGLGAGVRSYAQNLHYRNTYDPLNSRKAIVDYIANINRGGNSVQSGFFLDRDERMRQYAIGRIERLDKRDFRERFGVNFEEAFKRLHTELLELSLAEENGDIQQLTLHGLTFRDLIAKQFFSKRALEIEEKYRPKR